VKATFTQYGVVGNFGVPAGEPAANATLRELSEQGSRPVDTESF
jgi:hypothetical protein